MNWILLREKESKIQAAVTTEKFAGDAAREDVVRVDKFTQSLLANYAKEGTTGGKDPKPDGHFYITKA